MTHCPPRGTDRAFRRLARLGADPAATLDEPAEATAELPAVHHPPGRHRRTPPARLTRDRLALGVTAAALAGAVALGAVTLAGAGGAAPGVSSVPPPVTTDEPRDTPSSARPHLVPASTPSPSRTREVERSPSVSPSSSSAPASPSPSPVRRTDSSSPSPSGTSEEPAPPPPPPLPPCGADEEPGTPPTCTPTGEDA
ncbi:hypothetical protein E1264_38065 [Actinomadura sp. KC216]|uniref:hypothetical protein n=1 Tax=Actinomadura sp. KC216 TaxID=2530370 RepID=UPI00104F8B6E|nr:hypothetical protein [Actinomadura sp. KC216]TDB76796.1 hypothetical protein E1264_38065 [Actinomadura sp. KC216]